MTQDKNAIIFSLKWNVIPQNVKNCYLPKCKELDEVKFVTYDYKIMPDSIPLDTWTQMIFINLWFYLVLLLDGKYVLILWQESYPKWRGSYPDDSSYAGFWKSQEYNCICHSNFQFKNSIKKKVRERSRNGESILFFLL